MVIGQDPSSAICIPDEEVARRHASIVHREDGKLAIQDLGSMNRMLVNGRAASEAQLQHGDTIELGRTKLLVQALVQAEVENNAPPKSDPLEEDLLPRHRFPVGLIMNALLVAALAVAVVTWHRSRRSYRTPQPGPNPLALDTYLTPPAGYSNTPAFTDATVRLPPAKSAEAPADSGMVATAASAPAMNAFTAASAGTASVATEKLDRIEQELTLLRLTMQGLSNNHPVISGAAAGSNAPIAVAKEPPPEPPRIIEVPAPPAKPAAPLPVALREVVLVDLRQNKFPASEEFEEMRVVNADLQITPANAATNTLRVEVNFFDRLDRDGTIVPSRATVTLRSVQPSGDHGAGQYSAGATYVVPRRHENAAPRAASYYGFTMRVYDGRRLLAADARPRNLLGETGAFRKPTP